MLARQLNCYRAAEAFAAQWDFERVPALDCGVEMNAEMGEAQVEAQVFQIRAACTMAWLLSAALLLLYRKAHRKVRQEIYKRLTTP
jgi:hypothetical protein